MSAQTYVPVAVELASPASPAVTFSTIAPIDLTSIFRGWGPMPAVVPVDNQPESWDRPGLMRTPRFSDGGSATERLTEYSARHSFAYELTAFTNMLQFLVQRVRGEWTISPYGSGSMVRWTYAFYPKAGRAFSAEVAANFTVLATFQKHRLRTVYVRPYIPPRAL